MSGNSTKQPYWVTAESWSDDELSKTAMELASKIPFSPSNLSDKDRQRFREFIFNISMSYLPEASSNYYWPDLYREVSERISSNHIQYSESALTIFCRNLLMITDKQVLIKLRAKGIHNYYLALILEQAGIGKDRNRIIRDYLNWLVLSRPSRRVETIIEWANNTVRTFIQSQAETQRRDIGLLENVLARIGTELISLVSAIEARPDRIDMIDWSWTQMRDWWLAESGSDLGSLTPSAEKILHEWIAKLSATWKRADIFRLSRIKRIECHWPDGTSASSYKSPLELPLGKAKIRIGNSIQDADIVDISEMDLQRTMSFARGDWHNVDDNYSFKLSDKPFDEIHEEFGTIRSVPVFGDRQNINPSAYFYGRRSTGRDPIGAESMRAQIKFKWRYNKLVVIIENVRSSIEDGGGYSLRVAGLEVWSGEIRNGCLAKWSSRSIGIERFLAQNETAFAVVLERGGTISSQVEIDVWPLKDPAFLVCGTSICKPSSPVIRWTETGDMNWRTRLIVRAHETDIVLTNINEISRSPISIDGSPYVQCILEPSVGARATVKVADKSWIVEYRNRLSLSYLPDQEICRNSISFVGAGNIRIIDQAKDAFLRCDSLSSDADVGLWLSNDEMECFCSIDDELDTKSHGTPTINIGRLAHANGFSITSGEFRVSIGTSLVPGETHYNFYIPPVNPLIDTTQLEKPSRINFRTPDSPLWKDSENAISITDVAESKYCFTTLRGERWEVNARWKPNIVDITIDGQIGAQCLYQYKLFEKYQLPLEVACRAVFTHKDAATLEFLDLHTSIAKAGVIDLLPIIKSEMVSRLVSTTSLVVKSKEASIFWLIDASPCIRMLDVQIASNVNGLLQLDITIGLASLFNVELRLDIFGGDSEPFSKCFWTDPDEQFRKTLKLSVAVRTATLTNGDIVIHIKNGDETIHKSLLEVTNPSQSPPIVESIKQMVLAYRETGSAEYLTEILLAYLCNYDEACSKYLPQDIATRICKGTNPESETSLKLALTIISKMKSGPSAYQALPSTNGVDCQLSILSTASWLLLSKRYGKMGILNPVDFSKAASVVIPAYLHPDKRIRDFSILVCGFAKHVENLVKLNSNIKWPPTDDEPVESESALYISINQISSEIKEWLGK